MGVARGDIQFLFYAKQLGASFENTLTLGRLVVYADGQDMKKIVALFKNSAKGLDKVDFKDGYSDPIYYLLGAKKADSVDFSDYEGATIIHDMNKPLPDELKGRYSVVFDSGTLEHIFNFPVAIKNCMEALKVGGHFIGITPANNFYGHGFYQFSPELYYRVFSEENGFKVKVMGTNLVGSEDWYETADPIAVKSRVELVNGEQTRLMIIAEKIEEAEIFKSTPQQSDYAFSWNLNEAGKNEVKLEADSSAKHMYRKLPSFIKTPLRKAYYFMYRRKTDVDGVGKVNPAYFKKVTIKPE